MTSVGVVRDIDSEHGWGVIDGPDVPGGCWVHFSAIAGDGYRALVRGQHVSFRAIPVTHHGGQDGYAHRAVKVWTGADEPPGAPPFPAQWDPKLGIHVT